ncbi:AAA domain-containing protein [Flammeovirga sp. SubArs3]|uniref:AAA domain-containing protein n=1 Tax=Flammeovirga sp. SubArs3 TaxID=2995316 RepID=UPI00248B5ECA|nr:AAA domain-containing protein [Flammeovirga sp. SubArs3]
MQKTLKTYQKRLANLSARNKSLYLPKAYTGQYVDLAHLDHLMHSPSHDIIKDVIRGKKNIPLCPVADSRDTQANKMSSQIRKVGKTAKFVLEEGGRHDLFLGYPFVHGRLMTGGNLRGPLLFFPIRLIVDNGNWYLQLREDTEVTFNKTLLLAISHHNNVQFSDDFLELTFEDFPKDPTEFLTMLYHTLEESNLELNFNQDTFGEFIKEFEPLNKIHFQEEYGEGQMKLFSEALIGIFPQSDSYLMPDYENLLNKNEIKDLEGFFGTTGDHLDELGLKETYVGKANQEEELLSPYPMDASQEKVVKEIKGGQSVVVQGPPGSGKSQLICNLIADFTTRGKNVLVISQKRAALDVVYKRMKDIALGSFCAMVHDHRYDRGYIYQKIKDQIDALDKFREDNNSLGAMQLERNFALRSKQIDSSLTQLEEFREALYDTQECGISAKELYLRCNLKAEHTHLKGCYQEFDLSDLELYKKRLKTYLGFAQKLDHEDYIWKDRIPFSHFDSSAIVHMKEVIDEIIPFRDEVAKKIEDNIQVELSFDECLWILRQEEQVNKFMEIISDPDVYKMFNSIIKKRGRVPTQQDWNNHKKGCLSAFSYKGTDIEKTVSEDELGNTIEWVTDAISDRSNPLLIIKWQFSKHKKQVIALLERNNLPNTVKGLQQLRDRLENRMNLTHHKNEMRKYQWLTEFPEAFEESVWDKWFKAGLKAIEARKIYTSLRSSVQFIELHNFSYDELWTKIDQLFKVINKIPEARQRWEKYLSPLEIEDILNNKIELDHLKETLEEDFDEICRFDTLKESFEPHEWAALRLIDGHMNGVHKYPIDEVIEYFENSLNISWLYHIETKHPVLRIVSNGAMEQLESNLQEAILEKRSIANDMTLVRLKERTYDKVEYNRLNNRVTYRDLYHQVNKKRSIWPLRKTFHKFQDEILDLLPCWLTSPEAASAIFPLIPFFDLVIFDEASQCFAEKGIPAMYRGAQVAILGDSQQLPPFDLYKPRWEEDDEYDLDPALEVDSLLDLGKQYLSEHYLMGHYRSESFDLIDFSNKYFYKNKLRFIPYYNKVKFNDRGIEFHHIENGIWKKGVNQEEAVAVVKHAKRLVDEGEKSIGIITFNHKQQELIQEIMDRINVNWPSDTIVKNIENIQGDERDHILLSVTYAFNENGKFNLQFGALSQEGGEKRLNVAITRARKKEYIFSSILPHQLKTEEVKNEGPKLLKEFLHYAKEVSEQGYRPTPYSDESWKFGKTLKDKIKKEEDMTEQLPFSSLTVVQNAVPTALLMTDDENYHQFISAKDAHGYFPIELKKKDWKFNRFYSRNLWKNKKKFKKNVALFVEDIDQERPS